MLRKSIFILYCGINTPLFADTVELSQRISQLEQEVQQLKQQVSQLQAAMTPAAYAVTSLQKLTLKAWTFRAQQVKFDTYYALDVELKNNFDKPIKEIDARVTFKNLLGGHLYSITLNPDSSIPAGGTWLDQGGVRDNSRLLSNFHQMRKVNPQDVQAELIVRKIVFADNSILTF
jgi:cell division septum initiation protein DivIVA